MKLDAMTMTERDGIGRMIIGKDDSESAWISSDVYHISIDGMTLVLMLERGGTGRLVPSEDSLRDTAWIRSDTWTDVREMR